jgi:hypothetical protein
MCLTTVDEQYDPPSSFIIGGEKYFSGPNSAPAFQQYKLNGSSVVPLDEWLKADTTNKIRANDGKNYEAGFHVWLDENKKHSGRRVFVRYVTARGKQDGEKLMIAREMYVPSEPNGWPPKPGEPKKESMLDKAKKHFKPGSA